VLQLSHAFEGKLGGLAAAANLYSGDLTSADQRRLVYLHWIFSAIAGALVVCGLAFIILLFALYVTAGGILVTGTLRGTPLVNGAILAFGTGEQRSRYVRPILSAEELWSQGFSEPEAGSDLASLRTQAVERSNGYVLNGQKTWISWGQFSRWCGVLARTDPKVPRHKGISLLILDVTSPGVEMRPMEQITGHAEFCELFLDDVFVPQENLLGAPGQGWEIAMHVVAHERGTAALPRQVTLRTWLDRLVAEAAELERDGAPALADPDVQETLARSLVEIEVFRHHATRTMSPFLNGGSVGPESSGVKLLMAQAEQTLGLAALEVLGDSGAGEFWQERYLYSRAASVYGGAQQIQRGIIADRVLALPKE